MKKILILEDNKAHMKALVKILSDINNIQIFEAYNMAQANYMLSLNVFDVFLVDIILDTKVVGNISGIDFVNQIRNNNRYQYTPVIFITSLEDPKLIAYKELHCYNYIEKPFDVEEIIKTVKEALEIPLQPPKKEYVYFRKDGILYSVKVDEVTHINVAKNGVLINTKCDCLKISYHSIPEILKILNNRDFVQCNRNVIINMRYVEYYDIVNKYVRLRGVKENIDLGTKLIKYLDKESKREG